MYKKLTVFLVITNVLAGVFIAFQYQENQGMKQNLIKHYIMGQHNITDLLNNAVESYEVGNQEGYISNLNQAGQEYKVVHYLSGNSSLGEPIRPSRNVSTFNMDGMVIVTQSVNKIAEDSWEPSDMEEIIALSDRMNKFTEQLNYDEITSGNSAKQSMQRIEEIIKKFH